eukprot:SAG31_NODE_14700_length_792_cov_0.551227_2_plen_83_part_00
MQAAIWSGSIGASANQGNNNHVDSVAARKMAAAKAEKVLELLRFHPGNRHVVYSGTALVALLSGRVVPESAAHLDVGLQPVS